MRAVSLTSAVNKKGDLSENDGCFYFLVDFLIKTCVDVVCLQVVPVNMPNDSDE
jgi:hypothetical protein